MDRDRLDEELRAAFGGTPEERRVVVRAAVDLADSGRYAEARGTDLAAGAVVAELREAPEGGPAERWNWWVGALELAHGGFEPFLVRRY